MRDHIVTAAEFLFLMLSRLNPTLSPRRHVRKAYWHAQVLGHIARWLSDARLCGANPDAEFIGEVRQWAARAVLDLASAIEPPPGYQPLRRGSLRRHARDAGGIEGQALLKLAELIVQPRAVSPLTLAAWMILFPETSQLAGLNVADDLDTINRIGLAIREWDLFYREEEVLWWQIDCDAEDASKLARLVGVSHDDLPDPGTSWSRRDTYWTGLDVTLTRHEDGGLSLQCDGRGQDFRTEFESSLRSHACEPGWMVQVNRHQNYRTDHAVEHIGTLAEVAATFRVPVPALT